MVMTKFAKSRFTLSIGADRRTYRTLEAAFDDFKKVPTAAIKSWEMAIEEMMPQMQKDLQMAVKRAGRKRPVSPLTKLLRAWWDEHGYSSAGERNFALVHTGMMITPGKGMVVSRKGTRKPIDWNVLIGFSKRRYSHSNTRASRKMTYAEVAAIVQRNQTIMITDKMRRWFHHVSGSQSSLVRTKFSGTGKGFIKITGRPFMADYMRNTEKKIRAKLRKDGFKSMGMKLVREV